MFQEDCQNYYKVLLMLSETDIMSCGTWGFAPECDVRTVSLSVGLYLSLCVCLYVSLCVSLSVGLYVCQ